MVEAMTRERFDKIINQLNVIKPYAVSWGCGDEFGGHGKQCEIDGINITPLIYDRNVFGFSWKGVVYYRTENGNAIRLAKTYADIYCKLQAM